MCRQEIKEKAKECLGNQLFGSTWLLAAAVSLILFAIGFSSSIITINAFTIGMLLLYGAIEMGFVNVFLDIARGNRTVLADNALKGFSKNFGSNMVLGIMIRLFVFLWGLLFFVPGVIKSYSYSMSFYIKHDNPDYTWKQCLDASKAMMKGRKWDLFIQDLSFVGWFIIGSLCFGIGTFLVIPYFKTARAVFYDAALAE